MRFRTSFVTSSLFSSPFQVVENERPRLGRVNAFAAADLAGGAFKTRLGYRDVIVGHEHKGEGTNKATIFRFKPNELIGQLTVDLNSIKDEMLRLADDSETLILNLNGVKGLDSDAVGQFILSPRKDAGKNIVLCGVKGEIRGILHTTKLDTIIGIFEDEPAALNSLGIKS